MNGIIFVIDISDNRNQYLAQAFIQDDCEVEVYSPEKVYNFPEKKPVYIFSPSTVINLEKAKNIPRGSVVFCLKCEPSVSDFLINKDVEIKKFFDDETLAMKNAYLTAEGALSFVIENTPVSIKGSDILVLGYGRVGKCMVKVLKNNGANVHVATNPPEERALAAVNADYVTDLIDFKKHLPYFCAVINTIPAPVIGAPEIARLHKECFVLDLASFPGGVDHERAKEEGFKTMHALGVPGRTAPASAGRDLRDSISGIIFRKEQKGNYE